MVIDMSEQKLVTLAQLRQFLEGTEGVEFHRCRGDDQRYGHIESVVRRFGYRGLGRADKGLVVRYLVRTTGYSRQQITRLLKRARGGAQLKKAYRAPAKGFVRRFGAAEVALLAETDTLHGGLSGPATVRLMQRALGLYQRQRYERLATISVAHLYNLRKRPGYTERRRHWTKTRATQLAIGERRAPAPEARPGFIRIDSVHQGDQDGVKGVYHINAVDCVTQWELLASCEKLSEAFLLPVIEQLLAGFPFKILGFHADNGSEYINRQVARMLEKLRVEFTKSRPRRSNDNALVETKNGAILRKHLGYAHIAQHFASEINAFFAQYLNPYLNFHRPCLFAEELIDAKGKIRKRYPQRLVMTPLEKLASLTNAQTFLRPDITVAGLQAQAAALSDNEAAARMNQARQQLFTSIHKRSRRAA
jgi:transposase InsO family protein